MTHSEPVLLVDDEKSVLDVMVMGFKKGGWETRTAISVEAALTVLSDQRVCAVVTDKNLPDRSGLELLREVGASQPWAARLIMTGFVSTESVLEAMRLGADDYLLKPFESMLLVVERVRQAVHHRRTQVEREALAASLRTMEKSLRKSESVAFAKVTELDLLQNVLELKIEEATAPLKQRLTEWDGDRQRVRALLLELAGKAEEPMRARLLAEAELLG